jgi:hypothetical protein
MNPSLLDTDIFSEVLKAKDPNVVRNATAYRQRFGRFTLSAPTIVELVKGFQRFLREDRLQVLWNGLAGEGDPGSGSRLSLGASNPATGGRFVPARVCEL